ncbi:uncharacterized protein [Physcomitrium patens]|nr:uncharacterized protein LOC112273137 [Physcomitrium patens]XP_024357354.1 uncharacterized protein LOC112273137 [Physcomitrium patens]XP_024357355.1 uncharacterized protein LOC112273137 [Physcomitrium patens]XP_024357357.1 uncharacterized protein LOC112273137 [Physcomitrium patens]XP_024357358.1 uncharacterized protein LOC112273137 [Physcomitrium patens]XP_024357359.1 uncharacterized protein LOC112273137 [Physcomitrium patens]XP_024357360.1 uncharacterized protein LOC112273137 [Physcomitriu|eukprot:XP_024357353.1 uncharacterized protein LOC112273137 [Physcomitrella patens]
MATLETLSEKKWGSANNMAMNWIGLQAQELLNDYFESNLEAEKRRLLEYNACIKIQVATRRFLAQQLMRLWHESAKIIQRIYRGHLGREHYHECERKKDHELRMSYFNYHANYIQKCYHGYWSRKYICDYYARKAFIKACLLAGERMKTLCTMHYKLQIQGEQEEAKRKVDAEIHKFFNENHHKCSTNVVKGAFYSPYVAIFGGGHSYLEENIRDARHQEVIGMGLEKFKNLTEDGIPIKQSQNAFFVKSSKALHSRMSIDTHRRLLEASRKVQSPGTLVRLDGHYKSRYTERRKYERWKSLLNVSDKKFDTVAKKKRTSWKETRPTMRCSEHYDQAKMDRKAAAIQELQDYPMMKEFPWTSIVAQGFLFSMYEPFAKVFPKMNNHHHWPKYSLRQSIHRSLAPPLDTNHVY